MEYTARPDEGCEPKEREYKRWTASRKMEVVLRYLRGEPLDSLSRAIGVPASDIEEWYHTAMRGIESSLKSRNNEPIQTELDAAKRRIGELSMENELLLERSRRRGVFLGGKWTK